MSQGFLKSSIGKKVVMGLTGLFLISFLVVHCFINSLIFFNDGGLTFNTGASFMAHNWLIRAGELVLFAGLILHVIQALILTLENKKARPVGYAKFDGAANSSWYSRSMGLLGTLLLIFLIIHLVHFWVKSRFTGLPGEDANGNENLYAVMQTTFSMLWVVVLYALSMISLAYHLLHGFQSAFQSLGLNHKTYTPLIKKTGVAFSLIIPFIFALMPVLMYLGVIK
ncbi:MAG: succinate dehydrogenase [Bacteroidetes bacterium]|jgi:succinate dehydrogenase / fumarate reductase cytochrome b subunit|nr:succinate dehydrogenase [Bacteroidota bacterium]MDF2450979.1 succinate dehydrogenase [Bacteroidota bacterium]